MHTGEEKLMENQLSNPTPLYLRVAAGPPINEGRFVRGSRGPLELFSWTLLRPRGPPIKPALFDRGPGDPPSKPVLFHRGSHCHPKMYLSSPLGSI